MDIEAIRYWYLRRVVGTALSMGSVESVDRLARRIGQGVFELNTPKRRAAESRVSAWRNEATPSPFSARIVREMYEHLGRFWVEALFARRCLRRNRSARIVTIEGEDLLRRLATSGRGCLIASAYYGNVGVAAWALGELVRPLHVVVDLFAHPSLRMWQREVYSDPLVRLIERSEASRRVPQILRDGGAVMLIAESPCIRRRAVEVSFLGGALRCHTTIGVLANGLSVPVAAVTCARGPRPMTFTLRCEGVVEPDGNTPGDAIVRRTMALLEAGIARQPEQYDWTTPTGTSGVGELDRRGAPEKVEETGAGERGERRTESGQVRRRKLGLGPGGDAHDDKSGHEGDVSPGAAAFGGGRSGVLVHQSE